MNKRNLIIIGLLFSIFFIILMVAKTTYSLIVDVTENDNEYKDTTGLTIKDLITDEYGGYNKYYYNAINVLDITEEEAHTLINSNELNRALNNILDNTTNNKKRKLTNNEVVSRIITAVNSDNLINNELKEKVIAKSKEHITEITDYLYNIKTK